MRDPYLSFVRFARNDDHGGNFLARMQASFNCLLHQLEKYRLESELVLVEWNPPPDRPPLREAVRWFKGHQYCTVRIIEVDPSIHRRYPHHNKIPIHRAVPNNVGIRRARGQFILLGTVDLLYPDELMEFLSSNNLKDGCLYRTTRWDVDPAVIHIDAVEDQLEFCQRNVVRVHQRPLHQNGGLSNLHTNASGDFLLMSRDCWHRLRGVREADIVAAHADSLLCVAAYAAGIREIVLEDPIRIYHIDHEERFNQIIKNHTPFVERLALAPFRWLPRRVYRKAESLYHLLFGNRHRAEMNGIPTLSGSELVALFKDLVSAKRSYLFNDEDWGLGKLQLPETIVKLASWDSAVGSRSIYDGEGLATN